MNTVITYLYLYVILYINHSTDPLEIVEICITGSMKLCLSPAYRSDNADMKYTDVQV